jgi:hypothetical protein
MTNNKSTPSPAIFGRRRRHPEKRIDCTAKLAPKQRKPRIDAVIKAAEKTGAKVSGATVATDGSVSLTFGEADRDAAANEWDEVYGKSKAPTRQ